MRTMTWQDLDFERHQDPPDWQAHWALGSRLAATGWVWRASCINAYRQPGSEDRGLYWGLRVYDPPRARSPVCGKSISGPPGPRSSSDNAPIGAAGRGC